MLTNANEGRRIKFVRIHSSLLIELLRQDGKQIRRLKGMPDDAKFVGIELNYMTMEVCIFVESSTYPPCVNGEQFKEFQIIATSVDLRFPEEK